MKPDKRRQQIIDRLRAVPQEWSVEELAHAMQVSPLTIRRDLDLLAKKGAVVRTIGGCLAVWRLHHADYRDRVANNFALKQAIGRAAAREVHPGDVLLISDGSTAYHLASCLGTSGPLSVYTNSVAMIGELRRFDNVRLYVLGGEYNTRFSFLGGALLQKSLENLTADKVFVGADAIDDQGRCLTTDQETAHTAALMLGRGRRKILLADHTKVRNDGGVAYGSLRDFDLWITSAGPESKIMSSLKKMTHVLTATANDKAF
ncbi:MAG: DeoR/GlpR family DNA-binding transcription regulator [Kiritimatiellia bacterium]|jgi:DeoR family fructose operon transcriptional repressor